jgi:hypothetical protein
MYSVGREASRGIVVVIQLENKLNKMLRELRNLRLPRFDSTLLFEEAFTVRS